MATYVLFMSRRTHALLIAGRPYHIKCGSSMIHSLSEILIVKRLHVRESASEGREGENPNCA